MSKIAFVYANSLFELALQNGSEGEILKQIKTLQTVLEQTPDFVRVLDAPMIDKDEKLKLIDTSLKGNVNVYLLNYIKVMVERKNALALSDSFKEYVKLYNQHNNIEIVVATTAIPLLQPMQQKLTEKLEKITGKTILLENVVDPSCIGGVVLTLSDTQIDDSIHQKLTTLKKQLTSTVI